MTHEKIVNVENITAEIIAKEKKKKRKNDELAL